MVTDSDLEESTYTAFFNKEMDEQSKKFVQAYYPNKDAILFSKVDSSVKLYFSHSIIVNNKICLN